MVINKDKYRQQNLRAGKYSCVVKRQGINSLAHRESPLKRTKYLVAWILVHLSGLYLLAVELIPRRGSLSILKAAISHI